MISKWLKAVTCAIALSVVTVATGWPTPAMAATPNDPYYGRQWYLKRIGVPEAWKTTQGSGIVVAVVDTGIDRNHEDLKVKLVKEQYDSVSGDDFAQDSNGHGTLGAGIIGAATNNKLGIAGVAPKAKLMAIRAFPLFDEDAGTTDKQVADGITWAVDHGADVINLSLGGLNPSPQSLVAIASATAQGALVIAAAGNESLPLCSFPAINPMTVCVGASDQLDGIAWFSNYGVRLDVVAPGTAIWSTGIIRNSGFSHDMLERYSAAYGTSFAAPIVSGVGALLMSMGASNVLAASIIRLSAKEMGLPGYDLTYGFGQVDAAAAVDLCKQIC